MIEHCGGCGEPLTQPHPDCERRLVYDPPRFCSTCGFRLDVQIFPDGVRSSCRRCARAAPGAPASTQDSTA